MAPKKQAIVTLDEEQVKWLEGKVSEGYSKSGLIRYALKQLMTASAATDKVVTPEDKSDSIVVPHTTEPAKAPKKVEIGRILEVLIEMGDAGKLDDYGFPNGLKAAKSMQEKLRNIDRLSPQSAFILGEFKVEVENMFSEAVQKWEKEGKV